MALSWYLRRQKFTQAVVFDGASILVTNFSCNTVTKLRAGPLKAGRSFLMSPHEKGIIYGF